MSNTFILNYIRKLNFAPIWPRKKRRHSWFCSLIWAGIVVVHMQKEKIMGQIATVCAQPWQRHRQWTEAPKANWVITNNNLGNCCSINTYQSIKQSIYQVQHKSKREKLHLYILSSKGLYILVWIFSFSYAIGNCYDEYL